MTVWWYIGFVILCGLLAVWNWYRYLNPTIRSACKTMMQNAEVTSQLRLPSVNHLSHFTQTYGWRNKRFLYRNENRDLEIAVLYIDAPFAGSYSVAVAIDDIQVYDDGWKHHIPAAMKKYVYDEIRRIRDWNHACSSANIYTQLARQKRQQEKDEKQKRKAAQREQFEREQRHLIEKFNRPNK